MSAAISASYLPPTSPTSADITVLDFLSPSSFDSTSLSPDIDDIVLTDSLQNCSLQGMSQHQKFVTPQVTSSSSSSLLSSTQSVLHTSSSSSTSRVAKMPEMKLSSTSVVIPQASPIFTFRVDPAAAPGYEAVSTLNVKRRMELKTGLTFKSFSLGKPSVCGDSFLVGTDDPTYQDNYLMLVNSHTMMEDARADPIVSYVHTNEHIRDAKWITSSYILAAVGDGRLRVFTKSDSGDLSWSGDIPQVHTEPIREMALCPGAPNKLVTGGFDKTLYLLDLTSSQGVIRQRVGATEDAIGSVKWPVWNLQSCPSVTLDNGTYLMYDIRENPALTAFRFESGLPELYAHERYTDHHVLLGYNGGIIKHLDMRMHREVPRSDLVTSVSDPWCGGIGNVEYNYEKHAFITSGYTDFTVWKQSSEGEVALWSHGSEGTNALENADGYNCTAAWLDSDTVVKTDSAGGVGVYIQKL